MNIKMYIVSFNFKANFDVMVNVKLIKYFKLDLL
jgi:hypothetical protein